MCEVVRQGKMCEGGIETERERERELEGNTIWGGIDYCCVFPPASRRCTLFAGRNHLLTIYQGVHITYFTFKSYI